MHPSKPESSTLNKSILRDFNILGASVDVYSDEARNFKGMFFQDNQMKDAFRAYPTFLH